MTLRRGGTSWRGPVQIRIWKVGPTPLAICQNKPPMSTSSFSLFSSSFPPPLSAIFNFADRYSRLRKKLRVPRFERKNFANNRIWEQRRGGRRLILGGGFVFRIEKELDWERSVFQILRIFTIVFRAVANEVCRVLLIENKKEWFISFIFMW